MAIEPPLRPLDPVTRPTDVGAVGHAAGLDGLHVGMAQADLTPALRLGRAGYGPNASPGYGALGRLLATVMVVDDGDQERVAIVAAELHAGFRWIAEQLGKRCAPLGLTVDRIFLASSHTHTGPGPFYGHATFDRITGTAWLDDFSDHFDLQSGRALVGQLADAVEQAVQRLAPARVGYGMSPAWGLGWNRSVDALFWMPSASPPPDPDEVPPRFEDRDEDGYRALAQRMNPGVEVPPTKALEPVGATEEAPEAMFADPEVAAEAEFHLDVMELAAAGLEEAPTTTLDEALRRLVRKQRAFLPLALPDLLAHKDRLDLGKFPALRRRTLEQERRGDRQLVDARVHCLWAETPSGQALGAICFFGATSTLLGDDHPIYCADAYGEAARRIERRLNPGKDGHGYAVRVGFAGGSLGDVNLLSPGRPAAAHPKLASTLAGATVLIDDAAEALSRAALEAIAAARGSLLDDVSLHVGFSEGTPSGRVGFPTDTPKTHALPDGGFTPGASSLAASELAGGMGIIRKLGFEEARSKLGSQPYDADDPVWPKIPLPPMEHPPVDLPFRTVRIRGNVGSRDTAVILSGFPGEVSSMLGTLAGEALTRGLRTHLGAPALDVHPVVASLVGDYCGYLGTEWEYLAQHYEGATNLYGRWFGEWATHQALRTATSPSRRAEGMARFSGGTREQPRFDDPTRGPLAKRVRPPDDQLRKLADKGRSRLIVSVRDGVVELWGSWSLPDDDRTRPLWFGPRVALEASVDGESWQPVRADGVEVDDRTHRFLVWREDDGHRAIWLFHARIPGASVAPSARLSLKVRRDVREKVSDRLVAEVTTEEALALDFAPSRLVTVRVPVTVTVRGAAPPAAPDAPVEEALAAVTDPWLRARAIGFGASGRLASAGRMRTTIEDLDAIFEGLRDVRRLVIGFHGGLVSERAGIEFATGLGRFVEERTGARTLFVVWKTGPLEVLPQTLRDLLTQPLIVARLFRWVLKVLGFDLGDLKAVLGLESAWSPAAVYDVALDEAHAAIQPPSETELEADLGADAQLVDAVAELSAGSGSLESLSPTPGRHLLSERFVDTVAPPAEGLEGFAAVSLWGVAKVVLKIANQVRKRHGTDGWNGWKDTIVEELVRETGAPHLVGAGAWSRMKANAREAYLAGGGGTLLADRLAEWLRRGGTELHVVAHSAGSCHAGHLLGALAARLPSGRVASSLGLLAPACDLEFYARTMGEVRDRVGHHRLFVLTRHQEDHEQMIPVLYGGSLLNLVSGLLEAEPGWPLLGMARFLDGGGGMDASSAFGNGLVRAPTSATVPFPGRSLASKHGGFDDDEATRESLCEIIGRVVQEGLEAMGLEAPESVPDHVGEAALAREIASEDLPDIEGLVPAALEAPQLSVRWPSDAESVDYAHLTADPATSSFTLTNDVLVRLVTWNRFNLVAGDRVLFGLRGCLLPGGPDFADWSPSVTLEDVRPDHQTRRCVLGVWQRSTGLVCVFRGSTVPNARYLQAYIQGGARANLLPTGAYRYKVGPHRSLPGCFLLNEEIGVFRPAVGKAEVAITNADPWTGPANVGDNLHPAFNSASGAGFDSAGCQTVAGTWWNGSHRGAWATFRHRAGLPADGSVDGRRMDYVLLTGREAALAANRPDVPMARLRFGSRGSDVRRLQEVIGAEIDDDFGPRTQERLVQWQRQRSLGRADGIAKPGEP